MKAFCVLGVLALAHGASRLVFNPANLSEGAPCIVKKGYDDLKVTCDLSVASGASVQGNADAIAELRLQQNQTATALALLQGQVNNMIQLQTSVNTPVNIKVLAVETYRIRQNGSNTHHGFIKGDVQYTTLNASNVGVQQTTAARMICEGIEVIPNFNNYGGSQAWAFEAKKGSSVKFRLAQGHYGTWMNYWDSKGKPKGIVGGVADYVNGWYNSESNKKIANGDETGNENFQYVDINTPTAEKWVMLAHYRIRVDDADDSHYFVQNWLDCDNCNSANTDSTMKMLVEGVGQATSFINYGGMSAHLFEKQAGATRVTVRYKQYYRDNNIDHGVSMYNDGNGRPRPIAVKCGANNCAQSSWVSGTTDITTSFTTLQKVTLPADGTYLIFVNYRIRLDGDGKAFVRVKIGSQVRMVVEQIATPTSKNFFNYGGCQTFKVTGSAGDEIEVKYARNNDDADFEWYNDGNGVSTVVALMVSDAQEAEMDHKTITATAQTFATVTANSNY